MIDPEVRIYPEELFRKYGEIIKSLSEKNYSLFQDELSGLTRIMQELDMASLLEVLEEKRDAWGRHEQNLYCDEFEFATMMRSMYEDLARSVKVLI